MIVKISYFRDWKNDGNGLNLEQRILAIILLGIWPVIILDDNGRVVAVCHDELELREALKRLGIL